MPLLLLVAVVAADDDDDDESTTAAAAAAAAASEGQDSSEIAEPAGRFPDLASDDDPLVCRNGDVLDVLDVDVGSKLIPANPV